MLRFLLIPFVSILATAPACLFGPPGELPKDSSSTEQSDAVHHSDVGIIFNPTENLAEYGHWRSSKIGGGGYLLNVIPNRVDPDRLYAHSDVGGIFRSDDGGRNWYMIHINYHPQSLDCVRDLLVDPENPDFLIAAVGDQWMPQQGIFKSTDGGGTWEKVLDTQVFGNGPNRSTGRILQRSPADENLIYAAPGWDGIFVSPDAGDNWIGLGLDKVYVNDLKIDRSNPNRLFLCAAASKMSNITSWKGKRQYSKLDGGLYRSEDAGMNWEKLSDDSPIEIVQSPVDPQVWFGIFNGIRIASSSDYGKTWKDASEGLPTAEKKQSPTSGLSYRTIGAGPDFLLVGNGSGSFFIKKPIDSPWREVESKRIQGDWFARTKPNHWDKFGRATASIVVDPLDPDHWYFSDYYAIYQSWDAGKTWILTIDGIENTVIHTVAQAPQNPNIVHMGMADNGYFRSIDAATSFSHAEGTSDNCKAIAVAPSAPETVYILAPRYHGWYADTIYVSLDGGKKFHKSPMTNIPKEEKKWRVNSLAVDSGNPREVYIGVSGPIESGKGGVWRSTDMGKSWSWDSDGLPNGDSFFQSSIWDSGFQLSRSPNGSMVAIKNNAVYYRNSDEDTWERSSARLSGSKFMQVLSVPDQEGVYLLSEENGGLHQSRDNGKTWTKILDQGIHSVSVDQNDSQRIAVALDEVGGILITGNGGQNWHPVDDHLPQRQRLKMAFAGDRLVVGTPGNGVFYLPLNSVNQN
ncbi:WD40/YVTN/BNR-like repeat-containing protein [Puniceicoccus vermicola]|uniref:Sortilin N-terminal domain-containing protein n=1 Tax=Puniceicoccus vermicola TaxID=388746 RepID=A0A7X1E4P4_9BACT|nr:hypothetical protein [Puniceicoccus vermicola]MBC2602223.1 hypothetical protein [Puniceicoccus vermicola]